MIWTIPPKPAEITEERIIDAILEGHFPVSSNLPAERELASQLGITRPTLREALQRLARDGWIEIRHGRPTRVRDYWHEGSLGVLGAIAHRTQHIPENFIPNLLQVRILLAPAYAHQAVEHNADKVIAIAANSVLLEDSAEEYAGFDWRLHHSLSVFSGNPVFTLILNGFRELYQPMACKYFQIREARLSSRAFYNELEQAARRKDPGKAEEITRNVMLDSLRLWKMAERNSFLYQDDEIGTIR
jgi:GntR family negative regulator for fad regulon and positive regulator of fabA